MVLPSLAPPAGPVRGRWSWLSLAPPAGPDREHWTCQGAVVLVKSGTPCWPRQGTVVLAGGSGPGRVWHPGWPRQGAVVLAGGSGPAESGALAGPVPSVQELSAGMHLRFLLHPKEPPCWVPGLCSQPPNPLLGQLHGGHFTWSGGTTSSPASEGPGTWHVPGSRSGLPELTQKLPFPHGAAAGLTASQALRGGPSTSQCLTL